jgi:hypothetical protein
MAVLDDIYIERVCLFARSTGSGRSTSTVVEIDAEVDGRKLQPLRESLRDELPLRFAPFPRFTHAGAPAAPATMQVTSSAVPR